MTVVLALDLQEQLVAVPLGDGHGGQQHLRDGHASPYRGGQGEGGPAQGVAGF